MKICASAAHISLCWKNSEENFTPRRAQCSRPDPRPPGALCLPGLGEENSPTARKCQCSSGGGVRCMCLVSAIVEIFHGPLLTRSCSLVSTSSDVNIILGLQANRAKQRACWCCSSFVTLLTDRIETANSGYHRQQPARRRRQIKSTQCSAGSNQRSTLYKKLLLIASLAPLSPSTDSNL